ncbi:hypothetical protein DFH06DRAFT_1145689 [Mycena polygramma]|nr:hypothetical protein DFH06DRAFT_1145689 [Mycena polygramma]
MSEFRNNATARTIHVHSRKLQLHQRESSFDFAAMDEVIDPSSTIAFANETSEYTVLDSSDPNIYGECLPSSERSGLDADGGEDVLCRDAGTGTLRDCQRLGRRHVRLGRGASLPMMFLRAVQ